MILSILLILTSVTEVARASDWISELTGEAARDRTRVARQELANTRTQLQNKQNEVVATENAIQKASEEIEKSRRAFLDQLKAYREEVQNGMVAIKSHLDNQRVLSEKFVDLVRVTDQLSNSFLSLRDQLMFSRSAADAVIQLANYVEKNRESLFNFAQSYGEVMAELNSDERQALAELSTRAKNTGQGLVSTVLGVLVDGVQESRSHSPLDTTESIIDTLNRISNMAHQQLNMHVAYMESLNATLSAYEAILKQLN